MPHLAPLMWLLFSFSFMLVLILFITFWPYQYLVGKKTYSLPIKSSFPFLWF